VGFPAVSRCHAILSMKGWLAWVVGLESVVWETWEAELGNLTSLGEGNEMSETVYTDVGDG